MPSGNTSHGATPGVAVRRKTNQIVYAAQIRIQPSASAFGVAIVRLRRAISPVVTRPQSAAAVEPSFSS